MVINLLCNPLGLVEVGPAQLDAVVGLCFLLPISKQGSSNAEQPKKCSQFLEIVRNGMPLGETESRTGRSSLHLCFSAQSSKSSHLGLHVDNKLCGAHVPLIVVFSTAVVVCHDVVLVANPPRVGLVPLPQ